MTQVQTVGGPLDPGHLGTTLMHEHVFVLSPEFEDNYDLGWDEEWQVANAIRRLDELKDNGIDTIVDLTVIGLGRYIPRIQTIAEATDVQIVPATGVYTYGDLPMFVHFRGLVQGTPVDVMADMFVADVEEGIADTGVRAGILKCATDQPGVTDGVDAVLRATARAHRRTGVPISTHTHAGTRRGLEQQRIFEEEGVDLSRVVIGHSGDTTDLDYLEELVGRGSFIGMDRFGLDMLLSFDERVDTVARMCERGHAGSMVLSHDASCFCDWFDPEVLEQATPDWHYLHISEDVLPALRERGVTEEQIEQMLVENPRRVFESQGAY